jgi:hypothetical protein
VRLTAMEFRGLKAGSPLSSDPGIEHHADATHAF